MSCIWASKASANSARPSAPTRPDLPAPPPPFRGRPGGVPPSPNHGSVLGLDPRTSEHPPGCEWPSDQVRGGIVGLKAFLAPNPTPGYALPTHGEDAMTAFDNTLNADGALIVGAGLAGLFTALKLAPRPVTVLSPKPLGMGASSAWAQGGVAAAMGEDDSPHAHAQDTE